MANVLVKNQRDGTLVIRDGSTTPNEITVAFCDGNLMIREAGYEGSEQMIVFDRGSIEQVISGNEQPLEWSFSARVVTMTHATTPTVRDCFKRVGGASDWVSTNSSAGVYTVDIEWTLAAKPDGTDEVITIHDAFADSIETQEADDANVVNVSGRAVGTTPTITP